ncbi:hypothetical protein B296_00024822, partial [Ensete ventricosum]
FTDPFGLQFSLPCFCFSSYYKWGPKLRAPTRMWVLPGSLKLFRTQEPSSLSLVTRFGRTGRPREGRPPFMWLPSRFQKEKEKKKKKPPPPFACPQKKSSGDLSGFPMLCLLSI